MRRHDLALLLPLCCLLAPPASAPASAKDYRADTIHVTEAWSRATAGPGSAVGYLTVENKGPADALIGASCDGAMVTNLHGRMGADMMGQMPPGDDPSMVPLNKFDIPAHGELLLKPGGNHLMLEDLPHALKAGDQVLCTLRFRHVGPLDVVLDVASPGATTPPPDKTAGAPPVK